MRGDKFASPGAKSFLTDPAGRARRHVIRRNAKFFKEYCKFFLLEIRGVYFAFGKLFYLIIGHFDTIDVR